uniref:zinc finger protein 431 n=1 Tax=Gasterosteus aculeatus aculeatus TaxID=481459 RepID=UPI001A986C8B|nr:zinc finger protein 431 [Gasterosteus aculeatus aculeatus]XP_040020426.1 zinc finger protein 431 [Gasterosteus aculeatus aculeatus]XP_040020427.1 zinc finger protein 431 [Gasterosteus aculeatus aculeatus]XP_040020428.1 zinc finger protein 431 [Gasterosteus aculeatus aculeatus]
MSIEYTIDIQLRELGYPDILQPTYREAPRRASSPGDSLSPGHVPDTHVRRLLLAGKEAGAAKPPSHVEPTTAAPVAPRPGSGAAQSPAERAPAGEKAVKSPSEARAAAAASPPPANVSVRDDVTERAASREMQDLEDYSDDSEVSDLFEEEEVDEDDEEKEEDDDEEEEDEEEEGLYNELSHSGDYRCGVCDVQLPSKFKLQDHMNLHTGARPYSCAECGKRFSQIHSYRVHLRAHASNRADAQTKVEVFRCRICLTEYATRKHLREHLSMTHLEKEFYECDRCKRVFTSLSKCENHVKFQKCRIDVICEVCGRVYRSHRSLVRHRRTTCQRHFKCTDCTKTFTSKNTLLKHSFSHLGLLPYTCVRCRCHYRLARLYRKHKCEPERIHCVACLREFLSQEDFQRHKKDTGCWGNQEPKGNEIRCLECGERFETPEELKKHAGAHQRVLKCAECGKGFRSALLLMSHMGGHAGNSPCLCQSCGLGFPHQQNYHSHLKTCGKIPQPASAPKKRPASTSSSSKTKMVDAKPDSSPPTNTAATPAAVVNATAAPAKESPGPGRMTERGENDLGQPDGVWTMRLVLPPPPTGGKLVVFLPVCKTDPPTPTSGIAQTLPSMRGPTEAPPPLSNEHRGEMQDSPLNLVTRVKRDLEWDAPLNLSNKSHSSTLGNIPVSAIKSEPGEFEISDELNSTERQEF